MAVALTRAAGITGFRLVRAAAAEPEAAARIMSLRKPSTSSRDRPQWIASMGAPGTSDRGRPCGIAGRIDEGSAFADAGPAPGTRRRRSALLARIVAALPGIERGPAAEVHRVPERCAELGEVPSCVRPARRSPRGRCARDVRGVVRGSSRPRPARCGLAMQSARLHGRRTRRDGCTPGQVVRAEHARLVEQRRRLAEVP